MNNINIMKKLILVVLLTISLCAPTMVAQAAIVDISVGAGVGAPNNLNIWGSSGNESPNARNNEKLNNFNDTDRFINVSRGGETGIFNTLVRFARDLKNIFFVIATIYFLIITLILIFSSNTEEAVGNYKKWIIWITIGLIVMQIAYAFTLILFDQWVSARLWASLVEVLVLPIIALLQTLAGIFFVAMAIFAFYRLVTANGNEEAIKSAKSTILYAIFGFFIIRFAKTIVEAFYGQINCESFSLGFVTVDGTNCVNRTDVSQGIQVIISIINFLNSFVAIAVLIMIIYAGLQILLSGGDEEKIKKWKQAILYVAIGLFVLVANFLILTFFLSPERAF